MGKSAECGMILLLYLRLSICVNKWWHNAKNGGNAERERKKLGTPHLMNIALIPDAEKSIGTWGSWEIVWCVEEKKCEKANRKGTMKKKRNCMVSEATVCVLPWAATCKSFLLTRAHTFCTPDVEGAQLFPHFALHFPSDYTVRQQKKTLEASSCLAGDFRHRILKSANTTLLVDRSGKRPPRSKFALNRSIFATTTKIPTQGALPVATLHWRRR